MLESGNLAGFGGCMYYTEDTSYHTDEEGSFEGDSESEEAPVEADQEEEIDA